MFGKKSNQKKGNDLSKRKNSAQLNSEAERKLKALGQMSTRSDVRRSKRKEKLDMYDMIVANLIAGNSIIEPEQKLDSSQLAIGFSSISSETQLTKYFMISKFPDFLKPKLIDAVRTRCMMPGLKINFYFNAQPHRINWDSQEMISRMNIWKQYAAKHDGPVDVFQYRKQHGEAAARNRMIMSTKYLNEAELEYKRSFMKVYFIIEVSAKRTEESLANMSEAILKLKEMCNHSDIKLTELRVNMIDWVKTIGPFSLKTIKEMNGKLTKRVLTDDLLANFNSYKQGRVGIKGVPLGIDILNNGPVMRVFKEDPDGADNWLIAATTGGGKSYWLKTLLTYLLAEGFITCIMDYEGDEYTRFANFVRAGNPEDVKIVSMGKGSTVYFDPCEIPDLTGDPEVDDTLKKSAISFILSVFRIIVNGLEGVLTKEEERVISLAIQRIYDSVGVTDDKETWHRSKGLRLSMIYDEIKFMVDNKELVDDASDNLKHKAAVSILDSASVYFEEGEAKYGTFKNPMSANELYKAKLVVFSFGMQGEDQESSDPTELALKQLSVAYVNIKISNYCKYVRHCFNVKVWEEFQRYGEAKGSASTIANVITGGRKRGDVNFIITNDLGAMLDDENLLSQKIIQNIQNYAIGKIKDTKIRRKFCEKLDLQDVLPALDNIAKAHTARQSGSKKASGAQSRYKNAFCIVLEEGKKAVVKVNLPPALRESNLFKTGVDTKEEEDSREED